MKNTGRAVQQLLAKVRSLSLEEKRRLHHELEVELRTQPGVFTEDDPLWSVVGIGRGATRNGSVKHDQFIYRTGRNIVPERSASER